MNDPADGPHANRRLCLLDDIEDGAARGVRVDPDLGLDSDMDLDRGEVQDLVLLRRGQQVFAYHNLCSHQGRGLDYLPGKFLVDNGRVVCAAHGSSFDIETGACCGGPAPSGLRPVPVRVVDGSVWLVPDDAGGPA